jgi:hypothetical protein
VWQFLVSSFSFLVRKAKRGKIGLGKANHQRQGYEVDCSSNFVLLRRLWWFVSFSGDDALLEAVA